ncbi:hypothetical protein [Streptomyces sp. MBT42]|nr:hypothetical protein [Streptomyces sp. MBT42]
MMTDDEWLAHWMKQAPRLDDEALECIVRTLDEGEEDEARSLAA